VSKREARHERVQRREADRAEEKRVAKIFRRRSYAGIKADAEARRQQANRLGADQGRDEDAERRAMVETGQISEAAKARSQRQARRQGSEVDLRQLMFAADEEREKEGRPSLVVADMFRRMSHATEIQNDWYEYLPYWTPVRKLGTVFGAGVELYFRLLRAMAVLFLLLFFFNYLWVHLANHGIFYGQDGNPYDLDRPVLFKTRGTSDRPIDNFTLAGASFASIPVPNEYSDIQEAMDFVVEYELVGNGWQEITYGNFLYFTEFILVVTAVIIWIFIVVSRFRSGQVLEAVDKATIEISDYTVYVSNLPKNTGNIDVEDLARWFSGLFGKVVEVQLASDDNKLFSKLFQRSELMMELKRSRRRVQLGTGTRKKVNAIKAKITKLDKSVEKMTDPKKRSRFKVVGAFVTFNDEDAKNKCCAYLKPDWISRLFRPMGYRYKMTRINAEPAEPPTNINYHNLQYSGRSQWMRRLVTLFVSIVVLVIAFIVVNEIRYQANRLAGALDWDAQALADHHSADGAATLSALDIEDATAKDGGPRPRSALPLTQQCQATMDSAAVLALGETVGERTVGDYYRLFGMTWGQSARTRLSVTAGQDDEFLRKGDTSLAFEALSASIGQIANAAGQRKADLQTMAVGYGCYCSGLWRSFEESNRLNARLLSSITSDCSTFATQDKALAALAAASSVLTVIFNFVLEALLKGLAVYERHHTVTEMMASRITKQSIILWINTGFIELIAGARFGPASSATSGRFGAGFYRDFTPEWYTDIGQQLLLTTLVAALAPLAVRVGLWALAKHRRTRAEEKALIQEDLNIASLGPPFDVAKEYAQMTMITLTCLMFSPGLPLMLVILSLKCMVQYFVDRWMMLRVCKMPPRLSDVITHKIMQLLTFGLFLFLAMGTWMYSHFRSPDIRDVADKNLGTSSAQTSAGAAETNVAFSRVTQANVFFLFIGALLMLFYYIVVKRILLPIVVSFAIRGVLGTFFRFLTCCCLRKVKVYKSSNQVELYQAYRNGKLQGTPTYAIIDQPQFKAHFEVDVPLDDPDDDLPDSAAVAHVDDAWLDAEGEPGSQEGEGEGEDEIAALEAEGGADTGGIRIMGFKLPSPSLRLIPFLGGGGATAAGGGAPPGETDDEADPYRVEGSSSSADSSDSSSD